METSIIEVLKGRFHRHSNAIHEFEFEIPLPKADEEAKMQEIHFKVGLVNGMAAFWDDNEGEYYRVFSKENHIVTMENFSPC